MIYKSLYFKSLAIINYELLKFCELFLFFENFYMLENVVFTQDTPE